MYKKNIITALLALVTLVGWAQEKPDTITINFQLASKTKGEMVGVLYPDFIALGTSPLQPVTDGNGQWTVKIPAYRTLHIQVWNQDKIQDVVGGLINLFCRPGTEANILLDDINNRCVITGENAEAHQAQIDHPLKIEYFFNQLEDMEIQAAAQFLRDVHEQNLHRIDSLYKAHPDLPGDYVAALHAIDNYGFARSMTNCLMGHFARNMGTLIENGNKLPKEFVDLLHEVETHELLHPDRILPWDAVFYFSHVMSLENSARNGIVQEITEEESDVKLHFFKKDCSVIDALDASDEVKQMMKSKSFLTYCVPDLTPQREEYLRSQLTIESFGRLQNHITQALAAKAQQEADSDEEAETQAESVKDGKDIFQELIAPYRGRVIYVDFWGTWCNPCMNEMRHVEALHEALKGLPVTYMYFANKSPKGAWQKASQAIGLDGEDCVNLRLPDQQQMAVEEYLSIRKFPTYLLIDPNGNIVNNDAPRPSEPEAVRESILKLIKK